MFIVTNTELEIIGSFDHDIMLFVSAWKRLTTTIYI